MPASARMFYFDALLLGGAGKVYMYEPVSEPLHPIEFWHRRFSGDRNGSILYNTLYSPESEPLMSMQESIDQKGATLIKLQLVYPSGDTGIDVTTRINDANTCFFGTTDTSIVAKYQVDYREPTQDSVRVILTRERRYVSSEEYTFHNKVYPALRFVVKETLETETEGFTESSWETTEIYALGIGLVYYKKPINAEFILEYRLRDIREYEDFFTTE